MIEPPKNSWEVCFVALTKKPRFDFGITFKEVVSKLSHNRILELNEWAIDHYTHSWLVEHTTKRWQLPQD